MRIAAAEEACTAEDKRRGGGGRKGLLGFGLIGGGYKDSVCDAHRAEAAGARAVVHFRRGAFMRGAYDLVRSAA